MQRSVARDFLCQLGEHQIVMPVSTDVLHLLPDFYQGFDVSSLARQFSRVAEAFACQPIGMEVLGSERRPALNKCPILVERKLIGCRQWTTARLGARRRWLADLTQLGERLLQISLPEEIEKLLFG